MSHRSAGVTFDTDFHVPADCLRNGHVTCRVVHSDCEILDTWDGRITFRVILLLKLTVREGDHVFTFEREVVLQDSVWLCDDPLVACCEVQAAMCRCTLKKGRVQCSGAVSLRFHVKKPHPVCPPCPEPCVQQVVVVPIILVT